MTGEDKEYLNVQELNVGRQGGDGSSAVNPSVAFGDGNTGFYEDADNAIGISIAGSERFKFIEGEIQAINANGPAIFNETASATNPTLIPNKSDVDTGLGHAAADTLSLISGAIEAERFTEVSSHVLKVGEAHVGLTANAGSAQGSGIILSSYNVYDTVGTAGDAATLPAVFPVGTKVYIKNGAAANSMDVFPASGDDLGNGADTQEAVAAGDYVIFISTGANSTWTKLMGGTA